jgi:hypothetical protein
MSDFTTIRLPVKPTATTPDGSDVRELLKLSNGSVAHFEPHQEIFQKQEHIVKLKKYGFS